MLRDLLTGFPLQGWFGVGGGLVFAIVHSLAARQRAHGLIRRWAEARGLTILSAKPRIFVPFFGPAKGQFFRVRLTGADGAVRQGWLRFHGWTTKPDEILVDWDAKAQPGAAADG